MDRENLVWLAGLLEGEGSFQKPPPSNPRQPAITVQMVDEDVIARVADLFGVKYQSYGARKVEWKPTFKAQVRGLPAWTLMKELYPLMGTRRRSQIDAVRASIDEDRIGNRSQLTPTQIFEIEARYLKGESAGSLGEEFGISKHTVFSIRQGRYKCQRERSVRSSGRSPC